MVSPSELAKALSNHGDSPDKTLSDVDGMLALHGITSWQCERVSGGRWVQS